jgi:hypothetical protein
MLVVSASAFSLEHREAWCSEHLRRLLREVVPTLAEQIEPHFRQVIGSRQPLVEQEVQGATPADPDLEREFLAS